MCQKVHFVMGFVHFKAATPFFCGRRASRAARKYVTIWGVSLFGGCHYLGGGFKILIPLDISSATPRRDTQMRFFL